MVVHLQAGVYIIEEAFVKIWGNLITVKMMTKSFKISFIMEY